MDNGKWTMDNGQWKMENEVIPNAQYLILTFDFFISLLPSLSMI